MIFIGICIIIIMLLQVALAAMNWAMQDRIEAVQVQVDLLTHPSRETLDAATQIITALRDARDAADKQGR